MRALVTGATGFVGSHVARVLGEMGHQVVALHRASSKLDALAGLDYESALGDVTDLESLRRAAAGCDWVFHVAAVAAYWRSDPAQMFDVNVEGTRKVLQSAREAGVKRVVFTSSAAAVGIRADGQPADETDAFNLPPQDFPYGYSKVLAEAVCAEAVAGGQDVVIVNPVVVLGPGDLNMISGDFILQMKRFSWTLPVPPGGVAVIDVRDVARMHIAAARQGRTGERYILGAANYFTADWFNLIASVLDVPRPGFPVPAWLLPITAALVDRARALGISVPIDGNQTRLGGRRLFWDFSKGWNELGAPLIDMRQSVEDTYRWYLEHGYMPDDWRIRLIERVGRWL
jgi:dihydroflavonol-4-reductase